MKKFQKKMMAAALAVALGIPGFLPPVEAQAKITASDLKNPFVSKDAFLISDQNLDQRQYHETELEAVSRPAADWESCDLRSWLNEENDEKGFLSQAFTDAEKAAIQVSDVKNEANPWSGISGGADTKDKIYLLSVQEALDNSYGFSPDPGEMVSRLSKNTDYTAAGGSIKSDQGYNTAYWLRSPGAKEYRPAYVGLFLDALILTEPTVHDNRQVGVLSVRPVMHVDLSDTSLWSYAGMVKADGTVWKEPETSVKKPGRPTIKSVKCTKANTVKLTLSKKVSGASGYQVKYATNKKLSGAKTKKFTGTSVTIGSLAKKTYYFKVRAYKKSGTKTVYGSWSAVKKVSVKGASTNTYKTTDFTLKLPAEWKGKYVAVQGEFDGMDWVAFYEKSCYKQLNEEGGWLFSIGAYADQSYEDLPSFEVLAKKGSKTYVADFPTDVQFEGASKAAQASYQKMQMQVDAVLASFKLR